ncbi:hypothetical protein SDC9_149215 [bioreactor metagenome]|uniref:Uncharacterized protein n=1 Tax=bioreactor metagenome TaxID=1076179 RepID=A0A645EL57_9ZZZZ
MFSYIQISMYMRFMSGFRISIHTIHRVNHKKGYNGPGFRRFVHRIPLCIAMKMFINSPMNIREGYAMVRKHVPKSGIIHLTGSKKHANAAR